MFSIVMLLAGCVTTPTAKAPAAAPKRSAGKVLRPTPEPPRVSATADWEGFPRTATALRADIERRADDLGSGPVAKRGQQLASLRLAASALDLVGAGSLDGAEEALRKSLSLDGANGYAYLFLAYVHHAKGRDAQAAEFAASARRYLPPDRGPRSELEGLALSIRRGSAAAGE